MDWLNNWTIWLIAGFVLLILEIAIPGVFIMWWGFAGIIVAGIANLSPSLPLAWQLTIFAVLSILFSFFWWRYQHSKDSKEDRSTNLNARDHAMVGQQGVVSEILENGVIRGRFGDTTWKVIGKDLQVGDIVEVTKVEGITLFVTTTSV
ncbi:NfeD family protein [Otariodibacter sp.]|uniref:NfeD family protein n=1 Tax=Otariodibacter sp. TaxID=3030919 RepID=UPI002638996B|nr:NfeD family protein [Otariodibacter sp.]